MAKHASTFNQSTLEVEVDVNENQLEIDLLEMEREFGLEYDSVIVDAPQVQQGVGIEIADARTLELFKGGKGNSMVVSGGASMRTGSEGSVGASTVNPDCPIRKKDKHKQRSMEKKILTG